MEEYYEGNKPTLAGSEMIARRKPTTRERLAEQRKILQERLDKIDQTLEALDRFPEFERIHNLLSEVL